MSGKNQRAEEEEKLAKRITITFQRASAMLLWAVGRSLIDSSPGLELQQEVELYLGMARKFEALQNEWEYSVREVLEMQEKELPIDNLSSYNPRNMLNRYNTHMQQARILCDHKVEKENLHVMPLMKKMRALAKRVEGLRDITLNVFPERAEGVYGPDIAPTVCAQR